MAEEPLEQFIENVIGESHLRVETDLGDGFVRLRSAEAERRQAAHDIRSSEDVVIEMLRNARDAHARTIFLAVSREESARRIVMLDDGDGIPSNLHELVFEPRVTSKLDTVHMDKWGVHGRGMALYSIAVNSAAARVVASAPGLGTSMAVETDLTRLGERADQSTFPRFEMTESGSVSVRGPRNILRTACEFALEHRATVQVYHGSPAETLSALYLYGTTLVPPSMRAFARSLDDLPVCRRLAYAADEVDLARIGESLGLCVSERTARRILDGQVPPASPLLERITVVGLPEAKEQSLPKSKAKRKSLASDQRGLRIAPEDMEAFRQDVQRAFAQLAESYYLEPDCAPDIKVGKDALRVSIPLVKLD